MIYTVVHLDVLFYELEKDGKNSKPSRNNGLRLYFFQIQLFLLFQTF